MKNQNPKSSINFYAKYSSIAFQMIAIILIGVFGGMKLDQLLKLQFPIFTVVLSLISVVLAMYYVVKDLIKPNKPKTK